MTELVCWHCGASITDEPLPLSRNAVCVACRRDLRCCRMCKEYDATLLRMCREDRSDPPRERERATFCDYFAARPNAFKPPDQSPTEQATQALQDLFGDTDRKRREEPGLDDLFGQRDRKQ